MDEGNTLYDLDYIANNILTKLTFVISRLTAMGSAVDSEIINTLATEMVSVYDMKEEDKEMVLLIISDLNVFCDSVSEIVNTETEDDNDDSIESDEIDMTGKTIKLG